jgi:hypothetical protein
MHGHQRRWLAPLGIAVLFLSAGSCPDPEGRPGAANDGSAHWAWAIAEPMVAPFAADAELYEILAVNVFHDGRLPTNTGSWGFVTWSPSRQEVFQVNVNYTGSASTETRTRPDAPGSNGQPVPSGWVNSTVVFQAAEPHRPGGTDTAQLVVFNASTWTTPGQWGINYAGSTNVIVQWDGTLIGTQ